MEAVNSSPASEIKTASKTSFNQPSLFDREASASMMLAQAALDILEQENPIAEQEKLNSERGATVGRQETCAAKLLPYLVPARMERGYVEESPSESRNGRTAARTSVNDAERDSHFETEETKETARGLRGAMATALDRMRARGRENYKARRAAKVRMRQARVRARMQDKEPGSARADCAVDEADKVEGAGLMPESELSEDERQVQWLGVVVPWSDNVREQPLVHEIPEPGYSF